MKKDVIVENKRKKYIKIKTKKNKNFDEIKKKHTKNKHMTVTSLQPLNIKL